MAYLAESIDGSVCLCVFRVFLKILRPRYSRGEYQFHFLSLASCWDRVQSNFKVEQQSANFSKQEQNQ